MNKNKTLKVLATSAMLASVAAPFGAGVVSANSTNLVDKVLNVSSNYDASTAGVQSTLTIKEDDTAFSNVTGETFRVVLPAGVKFNGTVGSTYAGVTTLGDAAAVGGGASDSKAVLRAENILEVTVKGGADGGTATNDGDGLNIPLNFRVDGATGELKLKVEPVDSTITGGEYTFATVGSGNTTAVAQSVESIGKNGKGGVIRIDETSLGSVPVGNNKEVKLKLPSNFKWDFDTDSNTNVDSDIEDNIVSTGSFQIVSGSFSGNGTSELTFKVNKLNNNARGSIYITPYIKADKDASYGDISVNISGQDFSDNDVVVAKYGEWGVNVKVEKVEEVLAGKYDENTKTAKITLEESVPGSFINGRDIDVELPTWVKVTDVKEVTYSGFQSNPSVDSFDGTDNKVTFTLPSNAVNASSNGKAKIEFKLELSVQGDQSGDIEAVVSGGGVGEQKAVIAKAVAPVTAALEGEASKVKIGTQAQDAPNIIITETKKGAIEKTTENGSTTNGTIEVDLPDGVTFASVPKVEVVEGDGSIDVNDVRRINDNNTLSIPVKGESIKPMKIKLSGVKLTVDRTVPEGDIELKVGGNAIVENSKAGKGWLKGSKQNGNSDSLDAGEFNTSNAASVIVAKTVTPAPTDTTATNIVFKLNSKTFTVDGKEIEMDAAPLVGWDRAYLPVRFAANALNVADDQIIWDDKTSTFTIFKGDRVITGKVGDKFLTVNGVKVPMDVPVWRNKTQTNNRVMVPIRYLANALNADIQWNQETSEITIQAKK